MKIILSVIFLFLVIENHAQQTDYIDHPDSKDTVCIHNLQLAKNDFESGKLKFCMNANWDLPFARMYKELDSLCKQYGLIMEPDTGLERDLIDMNDPNTYRCYATFMDNEISERFGINFKERLIGRADSIFKSKHVNDTISQYYCDRNPTYCRTDYFDDRTSWLEHDFFSNFTFPKECNTNTHCKDDACTFRVLFIVDTMGHTSNFEFYHSVDTSVNKNCLEQIKINIIHSIQKMNCWKPVMLYNHKIVSYGDMLIDLVDKRIN